MNATAFQWEEPNENNIHSILKNIFMFSQPQEQTRWNEAFTDTRFWAGDQDYVCSYYGNGAGVNYQTSKIYFNFIQSHVNMVSGYEREHRKRPRAVPMNDKKNALATQLTKAMYYVDSASRIGEKFSRVFEMTAVTGLELMQPYLDFSKDPINGTPDIKHWSFNSFIVDPYFKDPSMSDANYVITQEFLSKPAAVIEYSDKAERIMTMTPYKGKRDTFFYFLPENTTGNTSNLLVKTTFWYKKAKKVGMVANMLTGELFDYKGPEDRIEDFARMYRDVLGQPVDVIDVDAAVWECATFLNEELMYMGKNPLGFTSCPFVASFWNYDWQVPIPGLRARSLVRSLRSNNWLFNRSILLNHDAYESSLNTGIIKIENSLVNEDASLKNGQGKEVIIKEDAARQFGGINGVFQRLEPVALPASNFEMPKMLQSLFPFLSGVSEELLGTSSDDIPGILAMARKGAGLITLQKYFDQSDLALKYLWQLIMEIVCRWWTPEKFARIFNEKPVEDFFSLKFQQYDVIIEEGINSATQQNAQFLQLLKVQEILGPMGIIIPPDLFLKNLVIDGKDELIQALQQQQQHAAEMQKQKTQIEMTITEEKLVNLQADTAQKLGLYKERISRERSNHGLDSERESEAQKNESSSLKLKAEAFKTLIEAIEGGSPEAILTAATLLAGNTLNIKRDDEEIARKAERDSAVDTMQLTPLLNELEQANKGSMYGEQEPNARQSQNNTHAGSTPQ